MIQAKFLEREVWKPDRPEPDITRNKLRKGKHIKMHILSQPRIFLPRPEEKYEHTPSDS